MAEENSDIRQWLLLSEENILLNHGLKRMVNLVPLPSSILEERRKKTLDSSFEGRTLDEISETIRDVCISSTTTYQDLVEYRCNALCGLWQARQRTKLAETTGPSPLNGAELSDQQVPFTIKLNVLLTFPLVRSLSGSDVSLRKTISDLLFSSLRSVRPSSLKSEPQECLDELEQLLLEWLEAEGYDHELYNHAASAYVALALAVNQPDIIFRALSQLHKRGQSKNLVIMVPDMFKGLLKSWHSTPSGLGEHLMNIKIDDSEESRLDSHTGCTVPSVASNGEYVFVLETYGQLLKIGTGLKGTLRGVVYNSKPTSPGWLVFVGEELILAVLAEEWTPIKWHVVDQDTLELKSELRSELEYPKQTTLRVLSDGHVIYHVTFDQPSQKDKDADPFPVQVLKLKLDQAEDGSRCIKSCDYHVILSGDNRNAATPTPARLSRMYSIFGSPSTVDRAKGTQTTCGLTDSVLKKSAMYVSGGWLVMLRGTTAVGRANIISKTTARKEVCNCLCFSLETGKMGEIQPVQDTLDPISAISSGFPSADLGACYNPTHHLIWTCYNGELDMWSCRGMLHPHQYLRDHLHSSVQALTTPGSSPEDTVLNLLLYLALEGSRSCPQVFLDSDHSIVAFHSLLIDSLENSSSQCLYTLVAILKGQLRSSNVLLNYTELSSLRDSLWSLLSSTSDAHLVTLLVQLFSDHFTVFYQSHLERVEVMMDLLCKVGDSPPSQQLSQADNRWRLLCSNLLWMVGEDGHFVGCSVLVFGKLLDLMVLSPRPPQDSMTMSPELKAALSILSSALQSVLQASESLTDNSLQLISMVIEASHKWFEQCLSGEDAKEEGSTPLPTSPLMLLLLLTSLMIKFNFQDISLLHDLLPQLIELGKLSGDACRKTMSQDDLHNLQLPSPWSLGKTVESVHPVFEQYKFEETITFPGAKELFLKFDEKCSTQYNYDKLVVYAGKTTDATIAHTFWGNSHGFGSASGNWPKDCVKVTGDSVTFSFQMSSSRERTTPDKAVWGFACAVSAREEEVEARRTPLPLLVDVHCTLLVACTHLVSTMFEGAPPCEEEKELDHLLQSSLLQRCQWSSESFSGPTPRTPLPSEVITKLRGVLGTPAPMLRPSIQQLIKSQVLEELLVSAAIHHLQLDPAIKLIGEKGGPHTAHVRNLFHAIDALLRRLQVLAELEQTWYGEVEEIASGGMDISEACFYSYLQLESSQKSFELLCLIKNVDLSQVDLFSAAKQLHYKMEEDVAKFKEDKSSLSSSPRTSHLVRSVLEKARLLLTVDSVNHSQGGPVKEPSSTTRGVQRSPPVLARFASAPSGFQIHPVTQRMSSHEHYLLSNLMDEDTDHNDLLAQIFDFISSENNLKVEVDDFLKAAKAQWCRGLSRQSALRNMVQLLTTDPLNIGLDQMVQSFGRTLQDGYRPKEVSCSGVVHRIRDAFGEVLQRLVALTTASPVRCMDTVALLCCASYQRFDEECLLRSGVMKLLEHLCSPTALVESYILSEEEEERIRTLAWGSFRVLSNCCVAWEDRRSNVASSGLASQVSAILTQNLIKAISQWDPNDIMSCDPLQDNLNMLLGLSKSQMGRYILSQPVCVSQLLGLLVDKHPPPRMMLVTLKLCRVALPLMTRTDCDNITLPSHQPVAGPTSSNVVRKIIVLILRTLAEYLVVGGADSGCDGILSDQELKEEEESTDSALNQSNSYVGKVPNESDLSSKLSVFLHRRDDQTSADIIKPLLHQDVKQFRSSSQDSRTNSVDHVILMGKALTTERKAHVFVDEKSYALRKAVRWASQGKIVSLGPPSDELVSEGGNIDEKLAKTELDCKERNMESNKANPPQPFLSGQVAYSLVSEIIALLSDLLSGQTSEQVWATAIKQVLSEVLSGAKNLLTDLVQFTNDVCSKLEAGLDMPTSSPLHQSASLLNAAMATVGGFKQALYEGAEVNIIGPDFSGCHGIITSLSEERGIACVLLDDQFAFTQKQTMDLPLFRLSLRCSQAIPVTSGNLLHCLTGAVMGVLSCDPPTLKAAPADSNGTEWSLASCRLLAELRTRSARVLLSQYDHNPDLWSKVITDSLKKIIEKRALECSSVERRSLMERHCTGLRMLYRDAFRPSPPRTKPKNSMMQKFALDITRKWPPVHSCIFAHNMSYVAFYGHSLKAGSGGSVTLLATTSIPASGASFYWECHIAGLGGSKDSEPPLVTMGLTPPPPADKPPEIDSFTLSEQTCYVKSTGEAVQCNGADPSSWKQLKFSDSPLPPKSVLGCGWVREEQGDNHIVYFTLDGKRTVEFTHTPVGMVPFLQFFNREAKAVANFGDYPFVYPKGRDHREGAHHCPPHDVSVMNRELPFPPRDSDDEDEQEDKNPSKETVEAPTTEEDTVEEQLTEETVTAKSEEDVKGVVKPREVESSPPGPALVTVSTNASSLCYIPGVVNHLTGQTSFNCMLDTTLTGEEVVEMDVVEEKKIPQSKGKEEDPYDLLVAAWESKVFPIINQRFRNEQERKEGTEQIKGALRLGLEDIAQQTVEFLYDDVGRLPKELTFPTLEEAKGKAEELSADKLSCGQVVLVSSKLPVANCGVRMMQKTTGMMGVVLEVEDKKQMARVECYIPSDAVLVNYWYPIVYLEKPPLGHTHSPILQAADAMQIHAHRQLLECEKNLTNMLCRDLITMVTPIRECPLDMIVEECLVDTTPTSLYLERSPQSALDSLLVSPSHYFFKTPNPIRAALEDMVSTGSLGGLKEIVRDLGRKPLLMTTMSFPLGKEGEMEGDFIFPSAALLLVTCSPKDYKNCLPSELEEKGWIKFFCYHGSRGKHGRLKLREVLSYPQSQSSLVFGPTLLPSNQVHIQVPANSDLASSFTAHVHGLPKHFVMGLTAVEFILHSSLTDQTLLQECLSSLTHTLQHLSLPAVLKEMIFHLAAGVTRKMVSKVDFPDDLHKALIEEFAVLYSEELLLFGHSGDMEFPSSKSIAGGGKGRFFTYTQSLFEVLHSLFYLRPIPSQEEPPQPAPTGRLSVYERPSRKISRPVPVKSLSYDPTVVRVTPPTTDSKWVNDIHDTLSVMEEIVASGEISLFDLEAGLMISPQSRLIVITGISPAPDTLDVLRGLASNHGGLYRDTLYSCEEGVVLETVHNSKVPPLSVSVWNCESLKTQKETEVCVFTVGENLKCENEAGDKVLSGFLANQLETKLIASLHGDIRAGKSRIVSELFEEDQVKEILSLSENEFVKKIREQKVEAVWRCLLSCGIDLHGDKCYSLNLTGTSSQAEALVTFLDTVGREIGVHPVDMETWDIDLTESSLVDSKLHPLQGLALGDIRMLFVGLKWINTQLVSVLPLIDLRSEDKGSLGHLVHSLCPFLFYDTKITFLNRLLNASAHRPEGHAPREVKLNPLEVIESKSGSVVETHFGQTAQQLMTISSKQLRVQLAAGGDPTYAFNVKMVGEDVMGTSGSFRHFLWQAIHELHSTKLQILMSCPSSAAGINKDKFILTPGPLTASLEKLLIFFGQLLGVVLRADIPVPLDLLPCVWKVLLNQTIDLDDLKQADILTYTYAQNIIKAENEEILDSILISEDGNECCFVATLLNGEVVELGSRGSERLVTMDNKKEFADLLCQSRLKELSCCSRVRAIQAGLATVVPLDCLKVLTPDDLALRMCGVPYVDVNYLKRHTIYQKGISEKDPHVMYFWSALNSFSQDNLKKFVKFACNQERIPSTNPNRDEEAGTVVHIPPYPMIIAPAPGKGPPDQRFIRTETCMFMVKLPKYTTEEIMKKRLNDAISFREDPLVG